MIGFYDLDTNTRNVIDYALDMILNDLYDDIEADIKTHLKKSVSEHQTNLAIGSIGLTALEDKLAMHYEYSDSLSKELNAFFWGFLGKIRPNEDAVAWIGHFLAGEVVERQPDNWWREQDKAEVQ